MNIDIIPYERLSVDFIFKNGAFAGRFTTSLLSWD
jgi:hypothetical protein